MSPILLLVIFMVELVVHLINAIGATTINNMVGKLSDAHRR